MSVCPRPRTTPDTGPSWGLGLSRVRAAFFAVLLCTVSVAPDSAAGEDAHESWRLVNYWSEWCGPCRDEIPMLNTLARDFSSRGIRVLGVNFDDDARDRTLEIADSLGIEFPTLTRAEQAALGLRAPNAMPTTFILAPDGAAVARLVGLQSRDAIVARLRELGALDTP